MRRSTLGIAGSFVLLTWFGISVGDPTQDHSVLPAEARGDGPEIPLASVGTMTLPRAAHAATLLESGEVLITGGCVEGSCEGRTAVAELYDPHTQSFAGVDDMLTGRVSHTATLLADGRVLIAGGWGPDGILAAAELYDPATRTFLPTGSLLEARGSHIAVLLPSGAILIVGGEGGRQNPLATAEVYDLESGVFTPAGRMQLPRASHMATLLSDGAVLVTGGHSARRGPVLASAEIFDPTTGESNLTVDMSLPRHKHAAVTMRDGSVLVVGGSDGGGRRGLYASAEVFDPESSTFSLAADLEQARYKLRGAAVLLRSGKVLVGGGVGPVEIYDPVANAFKAVEGSSGAGRMFATATMLSNGDVFIAGGYNARILPTANAWVYRAPNSAGRR